MWPKGDNTKTGDEELAFQYYRSGDKAVFGLLFERHIKTVYGVCLFYFRDADKAKDAAMQIFEKLMTGLRKNKVSNFRAWLSYVTRNYCISELRKLKGRYFLPEKYLEFEIEECSLEEEEKLAGVHEDQLLQYLQESLPQLKEQQRRCLELFYLEAKSYLEICDITGFSAGEVKSYIQNGKRKLKLIIEEKIKNKKHAA